MNPRVVNVKPTKNFTLELTFSNGEKGIFDVKPLLDKGLFKELCDVTMFNSVRPILGSIKWQNGLDLCPDTLYIDSVKFASSKVMEFDQQMVAEKKERYDPGP